MFVNRSGIPESRVTNGVSNSSPANSQLENNTVGGAPKEADSTHFILPSSLTRQRTHQFNSELIQLLRRRQI